MTPFHPKPLLKTKIRNDYRRNARPSRTPALPATHKRVSLTPRAHVGRDVGRSTPSCAQENLGLSNPPLTGLIHPSSVVGPLSPPTAGPRVIRASPAPPESRFCPRSHARSPCHVTAATAEGSRPLGPGFHALDLRDRADGRTTGRAQEGPQGPVEGGPGAGRGVRARGTPQNSPSSTEFGNLRVGPNQGPDAQNGLVDVSKEVP